MVLQQKMRTVRLLWLEIENIRVEIYCLEKRLVSELDLECKMSLDLANIRFLHFLKDMSLLIDYFRIFHHIYHQCYYGFSLCFKLPMLFYLERIFLVFTLIFYNLLFVSSNAARLFDCLSIIAFSMFANSAKSASFCDFFFLN